MSDWYSEPEKALQRQQGFRDEIDQLRSEIRELQVECARLSTLVINLSSQHDDDTAELEEAWAELKRHKAAEPEVVAALEQIKATCEEELGLKEVKYSREAILRFIQVDLDSALALLRSERPAGGMGRGVPMDKPSFSPCPHHTPNAGGSVASELHGVCIFCWRDWWAAARTDVATLRAEVARLSAPPPVPAPVDVEALLKENARLREALRLIAAIPAFPSKDIADRALGTAGPDWEPKAVKEYLAARGAVKGGGEDE